KALRLPTEKLILTPSGGQRQLYDLVHDPREQNDLSNARAARTAELARLVEARLLSPAGGYHGFVQGGRAGDTGPIALTTGGGFEEVELFQGEPNDRFDLSADRRALSLDFVRDGDADELDAVHFRSPGFDPLVTAVRVGSAPVPFDHVYFGPGLRQARR